MESDCVSQIGKTVNCDRDIDPILYTLNLASSASIASVLDHENKLIHHEWKHPANLSLVNIWAISQADLVDALTAS